MITINLEAIIKFIAVFFPACIAGCVLVLGSYYFISEKIGSKKRVQEIDNMSDVELRRYIIQQVTNQGFEVIPEPEDKDVPGLHFISDVSYYGKERELYKPIYFREYK